MASENREYMSNLGVPKADFLEDVDSFMQKEENETAESVLKKLDELHNKYKFMECNLSTKKSRWYKRCVSGEHQRRLKSQIPDIKTSLDIVKHLQSKKDSTDDLQTHFLLSDQVYAKAKIPPTEKVCLWLGANVMLEYNLDDAQSLLAKNLAAATKNLTQVDDDIGYLRDQTTTVEVNMARVYNWDVKRRTGQNPKS